MLQWRYYPVTLVLIMVVNCAHSASFDCQKVKTDREKLVCGDMELSQDDVDLSRAYTEVRNRLSPEGSANLRAEQLAWLRFVDKACPIPTNGAQDGSTNARFCLNNQYRWRIRELRQDGTQFGPFKFVSHNIHSAISIRPECDDSDENANQSGGKEQNSLSYPQIDSPLTTQAFQWNGLVQAAALKSYNNPKQIVSSLYYSLGIVNDRLISLAWFKGLCDGTRRGSDEEVSQNIVLAPRLHALVPTDLFRADRDWLGTLRDRAVALFKHSQAGGTYVVDYGAFRRAIGDPERWQLTADGLNILIDKNEFGLCDACRPDITIPWHDLGDILVPHSPVS